MHHARLFRAAHARMHKYLNNYILHRELKDFDFITPPGLGSAAGIKGALALAIDAA